jgi:transcriptional regulator with XRE-family HTH domain
MIELLDPETPLGLEDPAMDAKTIGERIRALRAARNLTQVQLAKLLGTSQQNLARWETGTDIPARVIPDIAAALKVPVAKLFPKEPRTKAKRPGNH